MIAAGAAGKNAPVKAQKTLEELEAQVQFDAITDCASALMDAGEMDIYSAVREELKRVADAALLDDDMFADPVKQDEFVNKVCLGAPCTNT